MLATGQVETDPFHPSSSVHSLFSQQFLLLLKSVLIVSSIWHLHCALLIVPVYTFAS